MNPCADLHEQMVETSPKVERARLSVHEIRDNCNEKRDQALQELEDNADVCGFVDGLVAAMRYAWGMNEIQTVGYAGMGIMGSAMAANLVGAGFSVTVWNRTPGKCEPLREKGAAVAESLEALAAAGPDVICLNVSDTPDVEAVLFGDDGRGGVASAAREGLIVIDNSTINPSATRDFAERLGKKGVTLMDAPVSGGDVGARKGTLSIMVGGPRDAFERCAKLFDAVGESIALLGPVGSGQVCKACNQIAVSCNLLGVCEAMALAKASGLDVAKMVEVVSGGAAGSWQLANLGPKIAAGDFDPGFMIELILKDLRIVAEAAEGGEVDIAGTQVARGHFQNRAKQGDGKLGTQAMGKDFGF